jgi:hypothetical protein
MSVHSLPIKRPSSDGAGARPASAALFSRPRVPRRRVLIRRSWVRAADEPAVPGRHATHTIVVRGETGVRRAA